MGVKYRYTNDMRTEQLIPGWDNSNSGRPVVKRDEAVLEYAALMEAGSAAPAIIMHSSGRVLDGIQRLAAAMCAGFTRFSAYVVECDSEDLLAVIDVLANTRLQGHAEKPEWTKRNAVQKLIIDRGMSAEEVAHLGGWRPSDLHRLAKVLQWGFTIRCIGGPQKLSDGIVDKLATLTTESEMRASAKPIAGFLNCIENGRFCTQDAIPYIEDFFRPVTKKSKSCEIYQIRLDEFKNDEEVHTRLHGRAKQAIGADVNLRRSLRATLSIIEGIIEDGEELKYIDEFFRLVKKIDSRLHELSPRRVETPRTPADKWT
jgi:hypothetical protein